MDDRPEDVSSWFAVLVVLLPIIVCLFGFLVTMIAKLYGCATSTRGPEECTLFGVDIGQFLYFSFGLQFYFLLAFLWIPIGLIILGLARYLRRNSF